MLSYYKKTVKIRLFDWLVLALGVACGFVAIHWSVPTLGFVGGGVFMLGLIWIREHKGK